MFAEGSDEKLLRLVMLMIEPLPADDTMTESDWRIRRDAVDGQPTVRVYLGPEGPNGELVDRNSEAYWFDSVGHLMRAHLAGTDVIPADFSETSGVRVAHRIDVVNQGKVALRVTVKDIGPPDPEAAKNLHLKGHEWQRAFTREER